MQKPLITIVMAHRNAADFVEEMLYSFDKLSFHPYKIIIRDNSSSPKEFSKLQKLLKKYSHININLYEHVTDLRGSAAHGEALNELVGRIDTEYGVIMDTDVAFLQKGWDKILIDALTPEMPIYGTQSDSNGPKPKDFPLMFGVLFKTNILKSLNVDWRAKDMSIFQDVGWELREKYQAAGLKGGLLYDFNTRTFKKGPFANLVCSEYYLDSRGTTAIFASHFGRGSNPNYKNLVRIQSSSVFIKFINLALLLPNYIRWVIDKKKWLHISKKIIDAESAR